MTDTRDSFEKVIADLKKLATLIEPVRFVMIIHAIAERVAALQAGAGDAQDAARYRWLRDHCNYGVMGSDNPSFALNCDEPITEWDAAIDRELAQATEGK